MTICSGYGYNTHDEIVYDQRECPACDLISQVNDLTKQVEKLDSQKADLQNEIDNHECKQNEPSGPSVS